jgi:hypothetical protein
MASPIASLARVVDALRGCAADAQFPGAGDPVRQVGRGGRLRGLPRSRDPARTGQEMLWLRGRAMSTGRRLTAGLAVQPGRHETRTIRHWAHLPDRRWPFLGLEMPPPNRVALSSWILLSGPIIRCTLIHFVPRTLPVALRASAVRDPTAREKAQRAPQEPISPKRGPSCGKSATC